MTVKTILLTLTLTTLPAFAFAQCQWGKQQAQSCAPGSVWDVETQACVEQVNS